MKERLDTPYETRTDHELWVEIIKLAKEKPEPMGTIRYIQSILERRHAEELSSETPDKRRIEELESKINGIDNSYLRDYSKYGTMHWRGEHPWSPPAGQL